MMPTLLERALARPAVIHNQSAARSNELGEEKAGSTKGPAERQDLRKSVGELVGGVFYATLLRQAQASKLKGQYMHGGRGEEVFQGQLGLELARKLGRAPNDPLAKSLYGSIQRRLGRAVGQADGGAEEKGGGGQ